jgi:hypothetical protein
MPCAAHCLASVLLALDCVEYFTNNLQHLPVPSHFTNNLAQVEEKRFFLIQDVVPLKLKKNIQRLKNKALAINSHPFEPPHVSLDNTFKEYFDRPEKFLLTNSEPANYFPACLVPEKIFCFQLTNLVSETYQRYSSKCGLFLLTSNVDAEPVLLRLQEAAEHGDLHVKSNLGVHERLVLVQLVGQLVQQPLDLILLRCQLKSTKRVRKLH